MSLEPRKYSERLGVLDADQLQAACDEFDALSDWLSIWEYGARHGWFEGTTFLDRAVPIVRNARAVAS